MDKPNWVDNDCDISYYTGVYVKRYFYNQDHGQDNIPSKLREIKWVPEDKKTYKCWWVSTNPADPADPGEDILCYIEELDSNIIKDLRNDFLENINLAINKLSLERLKNLAKYIKRYY